ncbi:hypothetical protein BGLT_06207 [Caballeronia glathei]|jgi:hypothetical protein|uniref:Uncharacterized protein n=2 Tax=Caballeronia glathei TaxID=60547 RepID=A0A069PM04_9BURK|nr:hypothetical protein BG61_17460 [Caballeronia glathei]TCK36451.1 hypothetical protein B0G84_5455 [Paraburkholderia sp. BL8N3]CDY77295.1 hypothetical protein BGLT_06207 [Caballeronia glathei]
MRNRATAPDEREGAIRGQWDYPATIMALRTPPDHERAELISAVVDAYGRLQDSVCRFLSMLADSLGEAPSSEALATRAFGDLLTCLDHHARAAGFGRMSELADAIEQARSAAQQRDLVFSSASSNDAAALRAAASSIERLDATFVGLCVDHVLDAHSRTALASSHLD